MSHDREHKGRIRKKYLALSMLALLLLLAPQRAHAVVSDCFDHYNHQAWGGQGLAIVLCRNHSDESAGTAITDCEIQDTNGATLNSLQKHGSLDNGRLVFTDYNTTGAAYPHPINIQCSNSQVTLTFQLSSGNSWEDGCCRYQEYGSEACCGTLPDPSCDPPDYQDPPVGIPGSTACPLLPSQTCSAPSVLLDVIQCSATQLTFQIDQVPDPTLLAYAELTMELTDADHPNEEGTVWVNGEGPLQLPAQTAWNNQTVASTLPIPLTYLVQGTNAVAFGAGPRSRTYYRVGSLALHVEGLACGAPPGLDAGPPDASHPDASVNSTPDAGTQSDADPDDGVPSRAHGGCNCGATPTDPQSGLWFLFLPLGMLLLLRIRRSR